MKRLLTIFLSSVVGIVLYAQNVPVTVCGDVYNAGILQSEGPVHVKAISPDKLGRIDNYGNLVLKDAIVFYTNDSIDGLLRNGHKDSDVGSVIADEGVAVRKNIRMNNAWHTMSLPFDVDLDGGVINPLTGEALVRGTDFEVQFYDAALRAKSGKSGAQNWILVPYSASSPEADQYEPYCKTPNMMRKGLGYRFVVKFSKLEPGESYAGKNYDVEFVAAKAGDVVGLFSKDDKGVDLVYNAPPPYYFPVDPDPALDHDALNSSGWNIVGGLNSDEFGLLSDPIPNTRTIEYTHAIYVVENDDDDWTEYDPEDGNGVLRPYGTVFLKVKEPVADTDLQFRRSLARGNVAPSGYVGYGGMAYYYHGNTLGEDVASPVFFRSSQKSAGHDVFKLNIADANNSLKSKPIYFKFNNEYSNLYKESEDDITWSIAKSNNRIGAWSLAKMDGINFDNRLFINSLPYENQEIPLGINIPTAGEYIFSLQHLLVGDEGEIESVILWDKGTDIKIELLQSDYRLQANSDFKTEDRFVIFFNSSDVTALDKMPDASEPYAYTENGILTVKNLLRGDEVRVLDLTGRTVALGVAPGNMFTSPLNQKGIYIINVRGGKTMKVLNK